MKSEYSTKCDNCKSKGEGTHARVFFKKTNNKWMWLCKICWNKQLDFNK